MILAASILALVLGAPPRIVATPFPSLVPTVESLPDPNLLASHLRSAWPIGATYAYGVALLAPARGDEAYLDLDAELGTIDVVVRTSREGDLRAVLTAPIDGPPWVGAFEITIPAAASAPVDLARFETARAEHYARLASFDLPGAAWFRHRATAARATEVRPSPGGFDDEFGEVGEAMDLFTGARAIAENLRLETVLATRDDGDSTIALDTIAGIETRAFDFAPLLAGRNPSLDPLASFVPADQHAAFFPTITGLVAVVDELDRLATPLLAMADDRALDAVTFERLQRQLCLPLSELGRKFGPLVLDQAAFTGSDPFLRTGSDACLLFLARDGRADLFAEYWRANAGRHGEIVEVADAPLPYSFVRNADRSISSYFARRENLLIVTNSPVQLDRVRRTISGEIAALASSDDYRFFRDRYPLGADESALVVLPDAAIRRWCSPAYRIGDARRTIALARLVEEQAKRIEALASDPTVGIEPPIDPVYGSLAFATPLAELALTRCTPVEAAIYGRFRDTYQRGFAAFFDPIALSLTAREDRFDFDLTVIPLIAGTEFEDILDITGDARLAPDSGRPHEEAIAQIVFAFDREARSIVGMRSWFDDGLDDALADPFAFLDDSVTFYLDEDPFLDELARAEDPAAFAEEQIWRIPAALEVGIRDPLRAGLFMTSLRHKAEEAVPGLLVFETKEHQGRKYVKVRAAGDDPILGDLDVAFYYAIDSRRLVVTPSEAIVKRALEAKGAPTESRPWLGESAALRFDRRAMSFFESVGAENYEDRIRTRAAMALPILDEWKRLFPDEDPVAVHERFFHERIVSHDGGPFEFDATRGAMTSSRLGDLARPRRLEAPLPILPGIEAVDLGIGFEHGGLRARGRIER